MKEFITERKEQLESLKLEILDRLRTGSEEFDALMADKGPMDSIDIAAEDVDRNLVQTLGVGEMNRLKAIDVALDRIASGHYGNCLSCGQFLGKERLEALPYAVLCVSCKNNSEKRR